MTTTDIKDLHPKLVISPSKAHLLLFTKMRDSKTSSEDFVKYSKRAMRIVAEDALAEFDMIPKEITTPCGIFQGVEFGSSSSGANKVDDICAVSIVRSGDALLEVVREIEPGCRVGKILIQRDESHPEKLPRLFYSKLPASPLDYVLLCDPMLATGGSAQTALDILVKEHGANPNKIVFCNMICAPEGLQALAKTYPQITIVTACVDEKLNEQKFIVPGLGDYGDRFFNTN